LFLLFAVLIVALGGSDQVARVLAQESAPSPVPLTFGEASLQIPAGWRHTEKQVGGNNALVLIPADFGKAEKFMLVLLPGRDLGGADFRQTFEKSIQGSLATGEHLVQNGETKAQKTEAGYELLVHTVVIEDASGHRTLRVLCAANPNRRFEMLVAMADNAETLKHYQGDFNQILASFKFNSSIAGNATTQPAESVPIASTVPA
jgi:hypothetical protein